MPQRTRWWARSVGGLAVLAAMAGGAGAAWGRAPSTPPAALPPELVAAWQKAGAVAGWMHVSEFNTAAFLPAKTGRAGELPAFRFSHWTFGALAKLPAPSVPFGVELALSRLTDLGARELAGLKNKNLQALSLAFTGVTDSEFKELAGLLKNLRVLDLRFTQVTGAGLKELAGLEGLRSLTLGGATDAGLRGLAGLKGLRSLDLGGTRVTDAGLKELAGLTYLQELNLAFTAVKAAGVKELQKALPGCRISGVSGVIKDKSR